VLDLPLVTTIDRVVSQKIGKIVGRCAVVDRHKLKLGSFMHDLERGATDPPQAIYGNSCWHLPLLGFRLNFETVAFH
jgi:hypothetical protein